MAIWNWPSRNRSNSDANSDVSICDWQKSTKVEHWPALMGLTSRPISAAAVVCRLARTRLQLARVLHPIYADVAILGDEALREIARELVKSVRANTTIDWTVKETVRAKQRVTVRRIRRRHGYPPDKQEQATQTVLKQAELLSSDWALEPALSEVASG